MNRYEAKRAVVIGGPGGMGLATAELLRDHGASVLVTGRTGAAAATARRQLGDRVDVITSDATSLADIAALGEHVEERLGRVDAMFVSAGISRAASVEETSEELYDEIFDVNVKGPVLLHPAIGAADDQGQRHRPRNVRVERQRPADEQRLRREQGGAAVDGQDVRA